METNLLDRMLSSYQDEKTTVVVTLQNKIRVSGKIKAFDSYVIVMDDSKREILYRHAIASIAPQAQEEPKRKPAIVGKPAIVSRPAIVSKPAPAKMPPPRVVAKTPSHKPRPAQQPQALSASSNDGINNSMKDGLLKWMQEQKAAK